MASVEDQNVPPEYAELYNKNLTTRPGWWGVKVDKKYEIFRTRNFGDLIEQSYFPTIAEKWNGMTQTMRDRWTWAGQYSAQSGWDLFAQDTAYRIANGISGLGEPHWGHQFKVGHIKIEAPASAIEIKLNLPRFSANVPEFLFNYCCKLSSVGAGSYARVYFNFHIQYDEEDYWDSFYWDISWVGAWDLIYDWLDVYGADISESYLTIKFYNMRGNLYFDGLVILCDDVNIVDDWQCNLIEGVWLPVSVPAGASFQSVYSRNAFYYS